MSEPTVVVASPAPVSVTAVPRAVWIGGGLLSLVTAALAGALIMRSTAPAPVLPASAAASAALMAAAPAALPSSPPARQPAFVPPVPSVHPSRSQHPLSAAHVEAPTPWTAPGGTTRAALCASCGRVESVEEVQQKGQGTGLGAVAGGVLGGVVGHQMGGGNGKSAMTVLGAIGGGMAGHEVEKRVRTEKSFNVHVRMEDGSTRLFQRAQPMAVGTRVQVDGTALRVARDVPRDDEPRTLRTSAPSDGNI